MTQWSFVFTASGQTLHFGVTSGKFLRKAKKSGVYCLSDPTDLYSEVHLKLQPPAHQVYVCVRKPPWWNQKRCVLQVICSQIHSSVLNEILEALQHAATGNTQSGNKSHLHEGHDVQLWLKTVVERRWFCMMHRDLTADKKKPPWREN